jgi:hypothetical protein
MSFSLVIPRVMKAAIIAEVGYDFFPMMVAFTL